MTDPTKFSSKSKIACKANLKHYISLGRLSPVWSNHASFEWNENIWDTPRGKLRFVKHGINLHSSVDPTHDQQFDGAYMEFAKAYVMNSLHGNPKKKFRLEYDTLRVIEAAMVSIDGIADITRLSVRHLDKAVEIIQRQPKGHVPAGLGLAALAKAVATHHISPHSIKYWVSPFTRKSANKDLHEIMQSLPDDDALLALAEIFSRGYHSGDLDDEAVYMTGVTAILLSVPMRIAEKLWLKPGSLKTDKDTNGETQWYLHYYVPKNNEMKTKEIPAVMVEHCKEAFARLEAITEPGRKLALYIESGSTAFYPHLGVPDVPADQTLAPAQVATALDRPSIKSASGLLNKMTGSAGIKHWTLNTLWQTVRDYNLKINPFFPYQVNPGLFYVTPPKMSESLLCFLSLQLSQERATTSLELAPLNTHYYSMRVAPDKVTRVDGKDYIAPSFFTRQGYPGLSLRSHQLRHFLNTAAKEAGVGIEVITEWSGRASVQQTREYIHQDPMHKAQMYGGGVIAAKDVTPVPITAAEYDIKKKGPIITTRYGICTHPWTISPCQKSGDCLNCSDLLHCKGHKNSLSAVKVERDQVAENLAATMNEIEAGNRPATRWVDTHTRYLERLNQVVAMHENPDIPDGSPVQMAGKDFTQAKRILLNKQPKPELANNSSSVLRGIDDEDLQLCLNEMMGVT